MSDAPGLDGLVKDFLVESHESLDQADQDRICRQNALDLFGG